MAHPARAEAANRKSRGVMLVDRFHAGGAEILLTAMALNLPSERFEVAVCATRDSGGGLALQLEQAGIEVVSLDRRHRYDVLPFRELGRMLRERRIDVLHSHMFGSNFWGSVVGPRAGVPAVIAHEHTWSFEGQPLRRGLDRWVIGPRVDAYIAGTVADRDRMISISGVPANKIEVIPGPYFPRPEQPAADLCAELGLSADVPLVGTIAVLRKQKAMDVLIRAFASIKPVSGPDPHLVIAGKGPCRAAWEALAQELGIAERVHFLGHRDDIGTILNGLDVATISSDFEGTSLFMLECMAFATPLVSTRMGGPAEFLEDGVSVLLVPVQDAAALADGLSALLSDPERRQRIGAAAHARLADFTAERIAAEHASLYERILASKSVLPDRVAA